MGFTKSSCEEFVDVLASKAPVPGGGGASALVGAIGMALGNMVGSLTVGKKKYADVEADIIALKEKATALQADFLRLVEADAEAFEPLAKAYGMPRETEEEKAEKARVMAIVLKDACAVPMEIMEKCCEAIDVIEEFAAKGSALAISDAGVGVTFCKAALLGASLNVFINTKSMADKEYAASLNEKADKMIADYSKKADEIFAAVNAQYQKADRKDHPRMIALDEAFAGVDETNIRDMFRLMVEFEFNFMINSQILWGDYDTVPGLAIYQLIRPENAKFVSVIRYIWNGKVKVMLTGEES